MKFLDNKVLLITGGTGSFGSAATKILLKTKIKKLIIFLEMKINSIKCRMR